MMTTGCANRQIVLPLRALCSSPAGPLCGGRPQGALRKAYTPHKPEQNLERRSCCDAARPGCPFSALICGLYGQSEYHDSDTRRVQMKRRMIINVSMCSAVTAAGPEPSETCLGAADVAQPCQGARLRASAAAGSTIRYPGGPGPANAPVGRLRAARQLPALLRSSQRGGETTTGPTGAPRVAETWLAAVLRMGEWARSIGASAFGALRVARTPAGARDCGVTESRA